MAERQVGRFMHKNIEIRESAKYNYDKPVYFIDAVGNLKQSLSIHPKFRLMFMLESIFTATENGLMMFLIFCISE